MKRRVILLLLFLVGGAIVNVAVAWGISMKRQGGRYQLEERPLHDEYLEWWHDHAPSDWEEKPNLILESTPPGRENTEFCKVQSKVLTTYASRLRYGWPFVAMERSVWTSPLGVVHSQDSVTIRLPAYWEVPVRPAMVGFAINTVLYALVLSPLFALPLAMRRWRRINRGLCPKCAYPVGDSPVCTECGKPLPLSLARERVRVREPTS